MKGVDKVGKKIYLVIKNTKDEEEILYYLTSEEQAERACRHLNLREEDRDVLYRYIGVKSWQM